MRNTVRKPAAGSAHRACLAVIAVLSGLLSCAPERERLGPEGPSGGEFTLGPATEYSVPTTPGEAIADSISSGSFAFPDGGSGTLSVARIEESPLEGPEGAEGFAVEYDGYELIELRLARTADEIPLLYVYGFGDVSPAEPLGSEELNTWWPVMPEDTLSNPAVFRLVAPGIPDYTPGENEPLGVTSTRGAGGSPGLAAPGALAEETRQSYRFMRKIIEKDRYEWANLANLRLITQWTVQDVIAALPDGLKDHATSETSDRLAFRSYKALPSPNVSAYSAFQHYRTYLGPPYRRLYPMMSYVCTGDELATEATVAHEVGHYFTHVFFGDDAFEAFYRAQLVTDHDIGSYHSQRPMLEEYAMYVDYFKNNEIRGGSKPDDPFSLFPKAPSIVDFPAQEAYATCLLAVMHAGQGQILNQTRLVNEDIPIVAMPHADAFEILFRRKPTNVNQLRAELALYLTGKGKADLLPAILERTGWSYNGYGTVVDKDGYKVAGATVQSVCKVMSGGAREYLAPALPVTTDGQGRFTLPRIFPGTNTIRVTNAGVEQDLPYTIDPNTRTDFSRNIGLLALQESVISALRRTKHMLITCQGRFVDDHGGEKYDLLESRHVFFHEGQWTGNEFVLQFADSIESAWGETERESLQYRATFSGNGSTLLNLQVTQENTTRLDGKLRVRKIQTIDIDELPLTSISTQMVGWFWANFDLYTTEIDPHVRSISSVEQYFEEGSPTSTTTVTQFNWSDATLPGHVGIYFYEQ